MIDNNPFLLFEIRGIDLINHYKIKNELEITYPFELKKRVNQTVLNEEVEILKSSFSQSFSQIHHLHL